jgi:hypothetical protein
MKGFFLLAAFICSSFLYAQYSGPESVEWDASNNRWLISNTSSHVILARTQSGVLSTFVPAGAITSGPHGIEILGNVLYACCGNAVKGFDLTTGAQVYTKNLGATFLNGITTDGDSVLYVTDFTAKKIYRVNPATDQSYVIAAATVSTPNGIIYDAPNNRCIFVNWGSNAPIKAIALTSPYPITTLTTTTLSNCDGITRDHLGYYYVTSWGNQRMNRFATDFTGGFTAMNSFVLNNPADIDCKFGTIDTIGDPNAGNNTCTFIPLAPPVPSFTVNDSIVCLGDQAIFTNTSTGAESFSWIFGGGSPGIGTTSPVNVSFDTLGLYSTVLTTTNVYGTTTSTHSIQVVAGPAPGITAVGNDLSTTGTFTTYQWYHNGVLIVGATSQDYTITDGGSYYCIVTDNSGCSGTSNTINMVVGIENNAEIHTRIFPNPVSEFLMLELNLPEQQLVHYTIIDFQGRVLQNSTEISGYKGLNYIIINLDHISNGTYILQINGKQLAVRRSFVVSK